MVSDLVLTCNQNSYRWLSHEVQGCGLEQLSPPPPQQYPPTSRQAPYYGLMDNHRLELHRRRDTGLHRTLLIQSRGVCSLSVCVCKLFCANRYYYAKNGSIATKLAQDGQSVGAHPGCAQGRGQGQRSRDTIAFVPITKVVSSRRQMAGLRPNLHTMVSGSARI